MRSQKSSPRSTKVKSKVRMDFSSMQAHEFTVASSVQKKCYVFGGEVPKEVAPSLTAKISEQRCVYSVDVYNIDKDSWSQATVRLCLASLHLRTWHCACVRTHVYTYTCSIFYVCASQ